MLSVVVEQPNQMAVRERPQPQPGPGEVRVRVRYAGICGSDVHILHGKNPFVVYPRVIGHEFVGRVDAAGKAWIMRALASWLRSTLSSAAGDAMHVSPAAAMSVAAFRSSACIGTEASANT